MISEEEKRRVFRELKAEFAGKRRAARKASKKAGDKARKLNPFKGQKQPRERNNGYLAFLRRQPCLKCGRTPSDAAHVRFVPSGSGWRYVGKGEKPDDFRAVPLCRDCHTEQHDMKESRFWAEELERDPVETCAEYMAAFLAQTASVQSTRPQPEEKA